MISRRLALAGLSGSLALSGTARAAPPIFRPGQVWKLKDRRYPTAQVIIGRLEKVGDLSVVHVSVLGAPASNREGERKPLVFGHMPFTEEAVRRSLGRQVKAKGPLYAGFEAGYSEWRNAKGGVFTLSIADALEVGIATMSEPPASLIGPDDLPHP